jgi:ABC-2 type transport system ATP-binding protein
MIAIDSTSPVELLTDAPPVDTTAPSALTLAGIERSWGPRKVLRGVDLAVPAQAVAWLGGPNGAGKTTLLRIAAGIILPDRGSISLRGLDPERDRRAYHKRLGYLCAGDRGLYARLTVRQNLDLACRLAQVQRRDHAGLLDRGIERFALQELAKRRVDRLSMGQRQRVRLAMAFIHDPEVVLLDEPHTSLDDTALDLLEAAMFECALRGGAVLWCSPSTRTPPLAADVRFSISDGTLSEAWAT